MIINNLHIKHRIFLDEDDKIKYYCNQACNTTDEKSTYKDNKVTCKNCLLIIKKRNLKEKEEDKNVKNNR